ncbi:hypothetical protein BH20VER2_BH20VER2_09520 [soil metagenome]
MKEEEEVPFGCGRGASVLRQWGNCVNNIAACSRLPVASVRVEVGCEKVLAAREAAAPRRPQGDGYNDVLHEMQIDILTLFPEICRAPLSESMMKRAQEGGVLQLRVHNIRDWATDKHRVADDAPFGGGPGMVMKPEPIFAAVESLRREGSKVLLMTPQGRRFSQAAAAELAREEHLVIICGHYEGIDHRVTEQLVDAEVSIGDYVLTNGAIAAVVVVDAVVRLLPGVLGHEQSAADDTFSRGLLEAPQYTRPAEFRGWKVPDILLSGNHAEIAAWRKEQALQRTRENRPDLLADDQP